MTFNPRELLKSYMKGLGYSKGDVLRPKKGADVSHFDVIDQTVIVLDQSSLAPHEYTVVGERRNYRQPSDRFVKFTINGHDWERA